MRFKMSLAPAFVLGFLLQAGAQQQANNWYFGNQAGMQFVNGTPNVLMNGQTPLVDCSVTCHSEGTAVMSDSTGSLLFYTNGQTVWNKSHQVMTNGSNLLGYASSTQGALIAPKPGSHLEVQSANDGCLSRRQDHRARQDLQGINT